MIFIFTALKSEAQAFVDKYRLEKKRIGNFIIFSNASMKVIISGLGVENMKKASKFTLDYFEIKEDDIFINIGICGADKTYEIGQLIEIGAINYQSSSITLDKTLNNTITCLDYEANDECYTLVDMESFGFYEVLKEQKNIYIFKVVSDHFEPKIVTKEGTKKLIFNTLDEIFKKVNR